MMVVTLQTLAVSAAIVILWRSENALDKMDSRCPVAIRIAFWLQVVGSFGIILWISQGFEPNIPTVLALSGIAGLLMIERRVDGMLRRHILNDAARNWKT
jgi:hypothetical protein